MMRLLSPLAAGATCAALLACPTRPPARTESPPPPPPVRVPSGCESSQAGTYHHAEAPDFRYLAEDDGGTLSLAVERAQADGGTASAPDAGPASIVLRRTPEGFR